MAVTVTEGWRSRTIQRGSRDSIETLWSIRGTNDDETAENALRAGTPSEYRGLIRTEYKVEWQAGETWRGVVTYSPLNLQQREPQELGSSEGEVSFATGAATQVRRQSISTIGTFAAPDTFPPDFKGLVNVQKDKVEGVEVRIPAPTYRESHVLTAASVSTSYMRLVNRLAFRTNSAAWKGFEPQELLFVGADFRRRYSDPDVIEATYEFEFSENATGLTVGDITDIEKAGHDYLWVWYEDQEDEDAERIVPRAKVAYVEQVYQTADFSLLQIGS